MRISWLIPLLPLPLLASAGLGNFLSASRGKDEDTGPSTFNDKDVPPILYLNYTNWDENISHGHWLVEFFSPYCGHCQDFAPTWKTLYEYYYTQDPPGTPSTISQSSESLHNFTNYYDFRFAKVDCVRQGDLCNAKQVPSFPTIRLYKDGESEKEVRGSRDFKTMSELVEEALEAIRPGSRPQGGPKLPKVGAKSADPVMVNMPAQTAASHLESSKSMVLAEKVANMQKGTPNPLGKSTPLTAENFQRLVTMTHDPWFIKFYAPWCAHCQDMAPNWQGMARQMRDQLNVGEVNCEVEKRLCKDVKVRGYPAILFFRGGERIEYDGLRGLGDLVSYANKAVSVGEDVKDVTAAQFEKMEEKEEVIFLYFYDHATTNEDFAALNRLVMSLVGHAKLFKTNDTELVERFKISTWPRLLVSRDGKYTYYPALSPRDMRDVRRVLNWMQSVWLPIVPELTASNAHEIMRGRLVVLGILSRDRPEEFLSAKREIKNAALEWIDKQAQALRLARQELRDAKQLRIEEAEDRNDQRALRAAKSIRITPEDIERREVGFAWIDGIFWERWIRTTFGISVRSEGEKVVIYDHDSQRYWDVTITGNSIVPSRTSIIETLPRLLANPPKISPKYTATALGHLWFVIKRQVFDHPFVSVLLAIACLGALAMWSRRVVWKTSEKGYFRVGEKGGPMDGLLGGGVVVQGKKD